MEQVEKYSNAFVELNEIIKYMNCDVKNKIPEKIKIAIQKSGNKDYKFIYRKEVPLNKQNLLPETKALLSILYSDYLCSKNEKEKWIEYDSTEQLSISKKYEKNYNIDEIFKDKQKKKSH